MRHSGLTLLKPSRLAIRLVPKLSENDLGLISVALKNSASLLLLLPLPPRLPLLNPVRIDIHHPSTFLLTLDRRGEWDRRFGRRLPPHHLDCA